MAELTPTLCTVCARPLPAPLLDFGLQPPANRFLGASAMGDEALYPLSLGACAHCGTAQLVGRMPLEAVRPRLDGLRNNEPEGHLDALVAAIAALPDVSPAARIGGLSYKDESTLARFATHGHADTRLLDLTSELPSGGGVESIAALLSGDEACRRLREHGGAFDLLIVRHVIEHTESARAFLLGLRELLRPGGQLVVEIPDNARIFRNAHHAFVWEEHCSYFTETSLRRLAAGVGARVTWFARYPYAYEDALVAVLRFDAEPNDAPVDSDAELLSFAARFAGARARWQAELQALRAQGERIAVFGAGHLAVKWINFLQLGAWVDCVVDDHPAKCGLRMPGSHLPILPTATLLEQGIRTCISTLSPESEQRVRPRLGEYFARGGRLLPAFPLPPECDA